MKKQVESCVFCQIIDGKKSCELLYQDDGIIAFRDKYPIAPVHILIMPKRHIQGLNCITNNELTLLKNMLVRAISLAREENISEAGYRVVFNCGENGGQAVPHLHLHLLGGRKLWSVRDNG